MIGRYDARFVLLAAQFLAESIVDLPCKRHAEASDETMKTMHVPTCLDIPEPPHGTRALCFRCAALDHARKAAAELARMVEGGWPPKRRRRLRT